MRLDQHPTVLLLVTRKLKLSGPTSLLKKFAACFPG